MDQVSAYRCSDGNFAAVVVQQCPIVMNDVVCSAEIFRLQGDEGNYVNIEINDVGG